jgi:ParB family chromosome partitioning protein
MSSPLSGIGRKLKPGYAELPIEKIASDGGRTIDSRHVKALSSSISAEGLLSPISVATNWHIVYGRHRLMACRSLGWKKIPAIVVDYDAMKAELAGIDENIVRKNLKALERSRALARRKEIYEALHPETTTGKARGGGRGKGKAKKEGGQDVRLPSFAADTAAATSQSERQVRRDVAIGVGIPDDIAERLTQTSIADNKLQLAAFAKLPDHETMEAVVVLLRDGEAKTVAKAVKLLSRGEPEPEHPTGTSGGPARVSSGQATEPDSDAAGASEPDAGGEFKRRLVEFCKTQLDNIDGLNWQLIGAVLLSVGDDCPGWN